MARPRKALAEPAGRRRTIWLLKKVEERNGKVAEIPNGGVRSSLPNCGYDEAQLKSLQSKGYRMRTEEVTE